MVISGMAPARASAVPADVPVAGVPATTDGPTASHAHASTIKKAQNGPKIGALAPSPPVPFGTPLEHEPGVETIGRAGRGASSPPKPVKPRSIPRAGWRFLANDMASLDHGAVILPHVAWRDFPPVLPIGFGTRVTSRRQLPEIGVGKLPIILRHRDRRHGGPEDGDHGKK